MKTNRREANRTVRAATTLTTKKEDTSLRAKCFVTLLHLPRSKLLQTDHNQTNHQSTWLRSGHHDRMHRWTQVRVALSTKDQQYLLMQPIDSQRSFSHRTFIHLYKETCNIIWSTAINLSSENQSSGYIIMASQWPSSQSALTETSSRGIYNAFLTTRYRKYTWIVMLDFSSSFSLSNETNELY